ncbi:PH domain associated with Beige/BEACH domain containing protein [Sarcoptes scabiei]|uniref:PH domain associated with Beige/BEACH domain containing protein n=1 Tax=Sarcoptes scabiei TaxID=52283 RepID=A0A132A658_SARSC|nr:PH domain associated with Beige/BEACH domain containing protein [Sarcoptes scabiei]
MDREKLLSIAHLNKLFNEIKQNAPSIGSSQHINEIHEQRIYNLLPLFCKIFNNYDNNSRNNNNDAHSSMEMFEKFTDAPSFTQMVSRLMVTEIRRRASNKTTENASIAIVEFLEISPTVNTPTDRKGWILLSTLNILVSFNQPNLMLIMTSNSLTSTLVKCLYLFFDLPPCSKKTLLPGKERFDDNDGDDDYLSDDERRSLLQKVFSQLLTRLCVSSNALADLTRKDDLILLFNVITSWCPEHNSFWRKTAADTILIMAKHGNLNMEYLHSRNCVQLFVENVQRIVELGTASNNEIILMFRTFILFMLEFLNNSTQTNQITLIDTLLDDFNECFGFQLFVDFAIKLEQALDCKSFDEFLQLVQQFTRIGTKLFNAKPLSVNQVFLIENFVAPKSTKNSVKNLKAFGILISLWNRLRNENFLLSVLDFVEKIYRDDRANYFILESQNPLNSIAEQLDEKSELIQKKYYSLLEFIISDLRYVPCKELISVGIILKRIKSDLSELIALKSLNRFLRLDTIFKDVFREIGLFDIICSNFNFFAEHLVENLSSSSSAFQNNVLSRGGRTEYDLNNESIVSELTEIFIQMLDVTANRQIFHECDSPKYLFQLIQLQSKTSSFKTIRKNSFNIIQQMIVSNNSEDNLSQLLSILHKDRQSFDTIQEMLALKLSVLKLLLTLLSENHRVRVLFRKIGGFVSVISVIVYMENYLDGILLTNPTNEHGVDLEPKYAWNLLKCVFATITSAMRFEPANSKYFAQEICSPSFIDSLRLLGCFDDNIFVWKRTSALSTSSTNIERVKADQRINAENDYEKLFNSPYDVMFSSTWHKFNKNHCACILMRLLFDMALDVLDRRHSFSSDELSASTSPNQIQDNSHSRQPSDVQEIAPIIIYPCIIDCIFQLLKFIQSSRLCCFLTEKLCSLLALERNIQVLCELGMVSELMNSSFVEILIDENNLLHNLVRYLFERLASHHIQAKDLRIFLRLSNPLNSLPLDEIKPKIYQKDRSIPISRIKSLISIATPKDATSNLLLHPPLTEFDMNQEGFSCIFIPSIAPISTANSSNAPSSILTGAIVGNPDIPVTVNGGIGTGERAFPSQSGLSYTTWICYNRCDSHENQNTNILTLYRSSQTNVDYSCFRIYINFQKQVMTISTQEVPIFCDSNASVNLDSDHNVRINCPELIEDNWHHIVVVLNRALLKNSTVSVFINSSLKLSKKISYISSIIGGNYGIANTSPLYINGFIGTPPQHRKHSKSIWKQGPCHLIEEALTQTLVSYIYVLGPNYVGSFQAMNYRSSNNQQQQIAEDKLIFGLNARATSIMTLSKMRRVYSKFDCKQIAKIIGLSTHENATPIYVLHNSSGHLCGPSRPLGGVLIGNIGARCFVPKQISSTFSDIGGSYLLLGLVANSQNIDALYASVQCLASILRSNRELQLEMDRINGHQILSVLLKRKKSLLNRDILRLLLVLISNLETKIFHHTNRTIYVQQINAYNDYPANFCAFKELLIDSIPDIWINQLDNFKFLLDHIIEITSIQESNSVSSRASNERSLSINHLREMNLLNRLLNSVRDHEFRDENIKHTIALIIFRLLNQTTRLKDIRYFGQFLTTLIPFGNETRAWENLYDNDDINNNNNQNNRIIQLRNYLLKIILKLISRNNATINNQMQEEFVKNLGFDWFLLFVGKDLNRETITIGMVNLMLLLSNPNLYQKFREGGYNGGWLKDAESFIENRSSFQLLGFNVSTNKESIQNTGGRRQPFDKKNVTKINPDLFTTSGSQQLSWLLRFHHQEPKVYLIILQTILGSYCSLRPQILDQIESFEKISSVETIRKALLIDQKTIKQEKLICKELILAIIAMIDSSLSLNPLSNSYCDENPKILIQFINYLYNHNRDFRLFCQTNFDFLKALCKSVVFEQSTPSQKSTSITSLSSISNESILIDNPATKSILEFIMNIFINLLNSNQCSMSVQSSNNAFFYNNKPLATLFLFILNNFADCRKAQTLTMSLLIDCIINTEEINRGHPSSMNQERSTNVILNFQNSFATIVVLMSIVVDKLCQNCYLDDKKKVLDCLLLILSANFPDHTKISSNHKSLRNLSVQVSELNLLYKNISRSILHLIARNVETMSDRILLFDVLQLIYTNRQFLIVSKYHNDPEFFVCLTYCLLKLVKEENICLNSNKERSTWYISDSNDCIEPVINEGTLLITSMAKQIWQEIYLSKKSLLEDVLKISLTLNETAFGVESFVPDITRFFDLIHEPSLKFWINYLESEKQRLKRKPPNVPFDLSLSAPNVITEKLTNINKLNNLVTKSAGGLVSKIVVGTSGVVGSAISSAVGTTRKEVSRTNSGSSSESNNLMISEQDFLYWTAIHGLIVKNFITFRIKQKRTLDSNLRKYIFNEWLNNEYEFLTRERAIWGPLYGSKRFDKWMLDLTEGPNRMRKKMIRNDHFYLNYPYKPEMENAKYPKFRSPISLDSKDYYKRIHSEKYFLLDREEDVQSFELELEDVCSSLSDSNEIGKISFSDSSNPTEPKTSKTSTSIDEDIDQDLQEPSDSLDIFENAESNSDQSDKQGMSGKKESDDNEMQTILRLLEEGERISHMFRVARIQGLDSFEGLLLFGREHFYLIDGFTLLKTKEIRDIDSLPSNVYDPIIPNTPSSSSSISNTIGKKLCNKFSFEEIREVHKRRYLLQPIALEIFSIDGRNSLMVFPRNLRNKVYARFISVATHITDNAQDSLMGQKRNVNVETGGIFSNLIGETSVTQRWMVCFI